MGLIEDLRAKKNKEQLRIEGEGLQASRAESERNDLENQKLEPRAIALDYFKKTDLEQILDELAIVLEGRSLDPEEYSNRNKHSENIYRKNNPASVVRRIHWGDRKVGSKIDGDTWDVMQAKSFVIETSPSGIVYFKSGGLIPWVPDDLKILASSRLEQADWQNKQSAFEPALKKAYKYPFRYRYLREPIRDPFVGG